MGASAGGVGVTTVVAVMPSTKGSTFAASTVSLPSMLESTAVLRVCHISFCRIAARCSRRGITCVAGGLAAPWKNRATLSEHAQVLVEDPCDL